MNDYLECIVKFQYGMEVGHREELIRCKDCKYGEQLFPDYVSCQISDENESGCHASHKPEWFCADGKRR